MTKDVETISGVPVTVEVIQPWADEAEVGYDPSGIEELRPDKSTYG